MCFYELAFEMEMDRRERFSRQKKLMSNLTDASPEPLHVNYQKNPAMFTIHMTVLLLNTRLPLKLVEYILSVFIIGLPIEEFYKKASTLSKSLYPFSHWKNDDMTKNIAFLKQDKEVLQSSQYYTNEDNHFILRAGKLSWGYELHPIGMEDMLSQTTYNFSKMLEVEKLEIWKKIRVVDDNTQQQLGGPTTTNNEQLVIIEDGKVDNQITTFEESLGALTNLKRIYMWFDYYATGLESLEELTLSNVMQIDIQKFSRDIVKLKNLRKLIFLDIILTDEYFKPLKYLKKLQTLVISRCGSGSNSVLKRLDWTPLHSSTIEILRWENNYFKYDIHDDIMKIPGLRILSLDGVFDQLYDSTNDQCLETKSLFQKKRDRIGAMVFPNALELGSFDWAAKGLYHQKGQFVIIDNRKLNAVFRPVLSTRRRLYRVDRYNLDIKDKMFLSIGTDQCYFAEYYKHSKKYHYPTKKRKRDIY